MNIVSAVVLVVIVAMLGGFVGLVAARITATLLARNWQGVGKTNKEIFIDVVTIFCTIFGSVGGGVAGYYGGAIGFVYVIGEIVGIPVVFTAIWGLVVVVRRVIKSGLALSDRGVKYLESRFAG